MLVIRPDDRTARWLCSARVALVYDALGDGTAAAARSLGDALHVAVRPLEETVARDQVEQQTADAMRTLQSVADLHRGETVVLVVAEPGGPLEVRIDGDGVVIEPLSDDSGGGPR